MGDICAHLPDGKIRSEAAVASINWKLTAATQPSSEKNKVRMNFPPITDGFYSSNSTLERYLLFPLIGSVWIVFCQIDSFAELELQ